MSTQRSARSNARAGAGPLRSLLLGCAALLLTALGGALPPRPVAAAQPSLAVDHPAAAVFRQMARRGGMDFAARTGRLPRSLAEIQDTGYSAYLFPTGWRPEFTHSDGQLTISSLGLPAWLNGKHITGYDVRVVLPQQGLYSEVETFDPADPRPVSQRRIVLQREWHFPGAQWLHEGRGWPEIEQALRGDRIATHINWLTGEYQAEFGRMPQTLSELETYLGTARNTLGWRGVTEVLDPATVSWQPGNLFAGWDHNAWVVSINLGPRVATTRWTPRNYGEYKPDSSALAY